MLDPRADQRSSCQANAIDPPGRSVFGLDSSRCTLVLIIPFLVLFRSIWNYMMHYHFLCCAEGGGGLRDITTFFLPNNVECPTFVQCYSVILNGLDPLCWLIQWSMGEGVLYNFIFTEFPCKTVSGDVTAFHRITLVKFCPKNPVRGRSMN